MGAVPYANIIGKVLARFGPEGWNWIEHGMEHLPENARQGLPVPPTPVRARPMGLNATVANRASPSTLIGTARKPFVPSLERKHNSVRNKNMGGKR